MLDSSTHFSSQPSPDALPATPLDHVSSPLSEETSPPPLLQENFLSESEHGDHRTLGDQLLDHLHDETDSYDIAAQHNFVYVNKLFTQQMRSIMPSLRAISHVQSLSTHLLPDTSQMTAMATEIHQSSSLLASAPPPRISAFVEPYISHIHSLDTWQTISQKATSLIASHAATSLSTCMNMAKPDIAAAIIEPMNAMNTLFATNVASVLNKYMHDSTLSLATSFVQNVQRTEPYWNSLASSLLTQALPTWGIANVLPMSSFLPDMRWLDSFTDSLNAFLRDSLTWQALRGLKDRIKSRLFAAFKDIGLCFAPSMSEDLMYQIAEVLELSDKRGVMLLVWNYYARDNHKKLRQTVEAWQNNPVYAHIWKKVFEPALRNHIIKDYAMSIYALAPQVEGISSHIVQRNTLVPLKKPRRGTLGLGSTESVILRAVKEIGNTSSLEDYSTSVGQWVRVKSLLDYVEDVFCQGLEFEKDYEALHFREQRLNRHGMLHGIQTNALTAFNSLRLFLLFDTIYGLLQTYIANGGNY